MRNMTRNFGSALVICALAMGALSLAPNSASAVTFEDSFETCSYPPMTDLILIRPLAMGTSFGGIAAFVPLGLLTVITAPEDVGTVYSTLVSEPWNFTFNRALGECTAISVDY